jgi:hypothetical protein
VNAYFSRSSRSREVTFLRAMQRSSTLSRHSATSKASSN